MSEEEEEEEEEKEILAFFRLRCTADFGAGRGAEESTILSTPHQHLCHNSDRILTSVLSYSCSFLFQPIPAAGCGDFSGQRR
jgi:hypothetical protein